MNPIDRAAIRRDVSLQPPAIVRPLRTYRRLCPMRLMLCDRQSAIRLIDVLEGDANRRHLPGLSLRALENSSGPSISMPFRLALAPDVAPASPSRSIATEANSFARSRELLRFASVAARGGCATELARAISRSRRMASDRSGLLSWQYAHASTFSRSSSVNRITSGPSRPVARGWLGNFPATVLDLCMFGLTGDRACLKGQA